MPEVEYKISACYFPESAEAELTWVRVSDGKVCAITVKVTPEEGNELAEVIGPCVYYDAKRKDTEEELATMQRWVDDLQSGMYINCVYCGYRYGPKDEVPSTMRDALKEHISHCPRHPMRQLKIQMQTMTQLKRKYFEKSEKLTEEVARQVKVAKDWMDSCAKAVDECEIWKKKYEKILRSSYGVDTC